MSRCSANAAFAAIALATAKADASTLSVAGSKTNAKPRTYTETNTSAGTSANAETNANAGIVSRFASRDYMSQRHGLHRLPFKNRPQVPHRLLWRPAWCRILQQWYYCVRLRMGAGLGLSVLSGLHLEDFDSRASCLLNHLCQWHIDLGTTCIRVFNIVHWGLSAYVRFAACHLYWALVDLPIPTLSEVTDLPSPNSEHTLWATFISSSV